MESQKTVFSRLGARKFLKVPAYTVAVQTQERVDGRLIMSLEKGGPAVIAKEAKKLNFNSKCHQTRKCSISSSEYDENPRKPWRRMAWTKGRPRPEVFLEQWRPAVRGPPVDDSNIPTSATGTTTTTATVTTQTTTNPVLVNTAYSNPTATSTATVDSTTITAKMAREVSTEALLKKKEKLRKIFCAPPENRKNFNRQLKIKSIEVIKRKLGVVVLGKEVGPPPKRRRLDELPAEVSLETECDVLQLCIDKCDEL